jgi:chromosome segregation ATPase
MNRGLQIANLVGVIALAAICVFQWRRDRALNLELNHNEKVRLEQTGKIAEKEKELVGVRDDLGVFKEQFVRAQAEASEVRKEIRALQQTNDFLTQVYEHSQENLTVWSNAVATRDQLISNANESIKTLNERAQDLGTRLNESIRKFNELATNYNQVVEQLNAARRAASTNTAAR